MPQPSLTCRNSPRRIEVCRADGQAFVTQNAGENQRPFIHPLLAPDGRGVLTEDRPGHHPWQHGLYVGLNSVNGVGFWAEGLLRGHEGYDNDGTFHPRPLEPATIRDASVSWRVVCDWRDQAGRDMLVETQQWTYTAGGDKWCTLDLHWSLTAGVDLAFGQYAYGGLFLRMPFRRERGAQALTSEGLTDQAGEGKAARWVALAMPIDGRDGLDSSAGIAILDHPSRAVADRRRLRHRPRALHCRRVVARRGRECG